LEGAIQENRSAWSVCRRKKKKFGGSPVSHDGKGDREGGRSILTEQRSKAPDKVEKKPTRDPPWRGKAWYDK